MKRSLIIAILIVPMPLLMAFASEVQSSDQSKIEALQEYLEWQKWINAGAGVIISGLLIILAWFLKEMIKELKKTNELQDEKIEELKKYVSLESKRVDMLENGVNILAHATNTIIK